MDTLRLGIESGIARVQMARASVYNAFNEAMIDELDDVFTRMGKDASVRVVVLSGQGKAFSAGADLNWMKKAGAASIEKNTADARRFSAMFQHIYACPKPTIACVHGLALGGGVGLTCACDIAIAADNAKFAVSEAKFGILPAVIGPYLVESVGVKQARRMALTTRRIGAAEALRIGLVHQVVPHELLAAAVNATCEEIRAGGPGAMVEIKQLYAQLRPGGITPEVQELCARTTARARGTAEAHEGFSAFLEKRAPSWLEAK